MTAANDAVWVRRTPTAHGELITLDAGALTVTAAPGLGGRLLSVTLGGSEFLYRNPRLLDDDLTPLPGVRGGPRAPTGAHGRRGRGGPNSPRQSSRPTTKHTPT
ncbi:hypothetical protein ABT001_24955, partial [Streptomyces sp. NPDC002793]